MNILYTRRRLFIYYDNSRDVKKVFFIFFFSKEASRGGITTTDISNLNTGFSQWKIVVIVGIIWWFLLKPLVFPSQTFLRKLIRVNYGSLDLLLWLHHFWAWNQQILLAARTFDFFQVLNTSIGTITTTFSILI